MIILHESHRIAYSFFKQLVIEAFKEKTTLVTKYFWLKDKYLRDRCLNYIHLYIHIKFNLYLGEPSLNITSGFGDHS